MKISLLMTDLGYVEQGMDISTTCNFKIAHSQ